MNRKTRVGQVRGKKVKETNVDDHRLGVPRRNLNLLYTLDAILNSNSLTEAALATKLSQPAVSIALHKAREQFNDPLVRLNSNDRFTELAKKIRPKIRKLLIEANFILETNLIFNEKTDNRIISVSMPEFVEVTFLPSILKIIRNCAPNIKIVNIPFSYDIKYKDQNNNIDFIIAPKYYIDELCNYIFLYDDSLSVMVDSDKNAQLKTMTVKQYINGSHVALYNRIEILGVKNGPVAKLLDARRVVVRTGAYASLPQILIGTDLLATTSSRYAQDCSTTLPLTVLPLPVKPDYVDICVQWQPFRDRDPMVEWFVAALQQAALRFQRPAGNSAIST